MHTTDDINATYNWWGTTDTNAISQTIHDNKNDFNLGKVNFDPILLQNNPNAMPNQNAPIPIVTPPYTSASPTPNPTQTPASSTSTSSTPTVPEFSFLAILPLLAVITFIVAKFNIKNF
jgi:hypothetical protein